MLRPFFQNFKILSKHKKCIDKIAKACYNSVQHTVCRTEDADLKTEQTTHITDEMSEKIIQAAQEMVLQDGAQSITVRKILEKLEITNRVFYNRFRNIDEVLEIVYQNISFKIRQSISFSTLEKNDFFEQVMDIVINSLVISYHTKMQFNQYIFNSDSASQNNCLWWTNEIKKLIDYAKENKLIKDVDSNVLSYAIWCFCRGYNADSVERGIPQEEAIQNFKYSFGFLLEGLKK